MGLFDFLKSKKKSINVNGLGTFVFSKKFDELALRGRVDSKKIGSEIDVTFPSESEILSSYQLDYFRFIESEYKDIKLNLSTFLSLRANDSTITLTSVLIPNQRNSYYDMEAEIVFEYENQYYSVIMNQKKVVEVIKP